MKNRNPKKDLRELCAEVHEDDGIDPRLALRRGRRSTPDKGNRKTQQLCKQVARALTTALTGECADPLLEDVEVIQVAASPDSGHLTISVRSNAGTAAVRSLVLGRLNVAMGFFRAQVASAITRKRVPELTFRLLDAQEAQP